MKKTLIIFFVCIAVVLITACNNTDDDTDINSSNGPGDGLKIGISLPSENISRWVREGSDMKETFEAEGFEVDLQYGDESNAETQMSQIENMISENVDFLIIATDDNEVLEPVIISAKDEGIPVIAYDSIIMPTDAITVYVAFDNRRVGVMQGEHIRDHLGLDSNPGPFNIEFFAGDPGDTNIRPYFEGAMSILQPYIDSGVLVCPSRQTELADIATLNSSSENARTRMENLISTQGYRPSRTPLHAVLCVEDSLAQGVTIALLNAGFIGGSDFPVVTGQDCDIVSVRNIIASTQSMSVFKDSNTLVNTVAELIVTLVDGDELQTVNTNIYNNGTHTIPTYFCEPITVNITNYRAVLFDSGYYTEQELAGIADD